MKPKLFAMAVIGLAASLSALPASAQDALSTIMARKSIRVAVPTDYPPFGFVGSDMQPQGMDIDMARLIAAKLGVKLELVPVTAPNRVAYLQTKKTDLTISSLGKTTERAKVIDFSIAYSPFFDAVFGAKGLKAGSYEDLEGQGHFRDARFDAGRGTAAPGPGRGCQALRGQQQHHRGLPVGTDAAVRQRYRGGLRHPAQKNPSADLELKVVLANAPCYVGVGKGETQLLDKVNAVIRQAREDGTIDKLSRKWLGAPAGDLPD